MSGMPPFAGFFAKFFILETTLSLGNYTTVFVLLLGSVFSTYYYLRMVKTIIFPVVLTYSGVNYENIPRTVTYSIITVVFYHLLYMILPAFDVWIYV